jgi:hypothetical protein
VAPRDDRMRGIHDNGRADFRRLTKTADSQRTGKGTSSTRALPKAHPGICSGGLKVKPSRSLCRTQELPKSKKFTFDALTPVGGQGYPLPQWQLLAPRGEHPRLVPPPDMRTVCTRLGRSVPARPAEGKMGCSSLRAPATLHLMRRRKRPILNEEKH